MPPLDATGCSSQNEEDGRRCVRAFMDGHATRHIGFTGERLRRGECCDTYPLASAHFNRAPHCHVQRHAGWETKSRKANEIYASVFGGFCACPGSPLQINTARKARDESQVFKEMLASSNPSRRRLCKGTQLRIIPQP
jgi:hypothetical protein